MTTPGSYDIPVKPGARPGDPTPDQVSKHLAIGAGSPNRQTIRADLVSDPSGKWRASFGPPVGQSLWVVTRIVIHCDAPSACEGYLYIAPKVTPGQSVLDQYMVSNTNYANLNENDPNHPYVIAQNQVMYMLWNTSAGTFATLNVEYLST